MLNRKEKKKYPQLRKALLLITGVVTIALAADSCKHSPLTTSDITDITPDSNGTGGNEFPGLVCDPDTVYFNNTILPLFISNCAKSGCHDVATAKEGIKLNSYENIISTGEIEAFNPDHGKIVEKISETDPDDRMPPPPKTPLTPDQISDITLWINQGAKNNGCDGCDTLNVTYSGIIRRILDTKCIGCHQGTSPAGNINLTTYDGVKTVALNGRLFGAVNHLAGYAYMPQGGNKLPQCEIDAITIWINAGAPQN